MRGHLLVAVVAGLLAGRIKGPVGGFGDSPPPRKKTRPTRDDKARIEAAQAKRDRKAAKRIAKAGRS